MQLPWNSWNSKLKLPNWGHRDHLLETMLGILRSPEIPNKGFLCTWQCAFKKNVGLFGFKRCFEMKLCKLAKGLLGLFYAMMWQKNMCTVTCWRCAVGIYICIWCVSVYICTSTRPLSIFEEVTHVDINARPIWTKVVPTAALAGKSGSEKAKNLNWYALVMRRRRSRCL